MPTEVRPISQRELSFLLGELDAWRGQGLIDPGQAEAIQGLYTLRSRRPVLLAVGAALVGLGGVSLTAARWGELTTAAKAFLILGAYGACVLAAWGCDTRGFKKLAIVLRLLASLAYGGGLVLLDGIFQRGWADGALAGWWLVGVLPMAALLPDEPQMLLAQALAGLYLLLSGALSLRWGGPLLPRGQFLSPPESWPLLALLWGLWLLSRKSKGGYRPESWTEGAASLTALTLLSLGLLESRVRACFGTTAALLTMALMGAGLSCSRYKPGLLTLERLGVAMAGCFGLALTYPECWTGFPAALLPAALRPEWAAAVALALLMLWQLQRGQPWGGGFLALLAARYLFDGLFDLVSKGWGFTALGAMLLGLGLWRARREGPSGKTEKGERDG